MGEFLRGQKAYSVRNLFGLEDALDFFKACLPESTGQDPFFEEPRMPVLFGEFSEFVGFIQKLCDGLSHFVVDDQEFEEGHSSEVPTSVAPFADFDFDGVSFGVDSLFGWGRDRWLVEFGDTASRQVEFLEELGGGLVGLFAGLAQSPDETLVQDTLHDPEDGFGMLGVSFENLTHRVDRIVGDNTGHGVFLFFVDLVQDGFDDLGADQRGQHEDIGLFQADFLKDCFG
jgi:hypothetical protein